MFNQKILGYLVILFMACSAFAQSRYSKTDYSNLFMASFMYMTAAKACNLSQHIPISDLTVSRVIAYGNKYNLQSAETLQISQNISVYTAKGIEGFIQTSNIRCSEVGGYVNQLSDISSKLN
jgi:hypothetical protein